MHRTYPVSRFPHECDVCQCHFFYGTSKLAITRIGFDLDTSTYGYHPAFFGIMAEQQKTTVEIYNTRFTPVRCDRGVVESHVQYLKGAEAADRVLCTVPQLISGTEYTVEATVEDGDDLSALEKFDFSKCTFSGYTLDHEEVDVKPVRVSEKSNKFSIKFFARGSYHLKNSNGSIILMNIDAAAAKQGVDTHLYYGKTGKKVIQTKKHQRYIQKIECVWNTWKHSSTPERSHNAFPTYYEPDVKKPFPWMMNCKPKKIPKFADLQKKEREKRMGIAAVKKK